MPYQRKIKRPFADMSRPAQIRRWVEKHFAAPLVESVFNDLIDVATGTREGNRFEQESLKRIFKNNP